AVKEYLDASPDIQRLFRAEARRLSGLGHPQLPAVRDHFCLEESGQYLVSDYVDGVSLRDLLDQYGPLSSDLIVGWLQNVCRPLAYLHEKKQIHLNVKPANIRLTPAGDVFLVDTGLPGLGVSLGTSGYAAPEQQTQGTVTAASDVYSLGATLYTLLTGRAPPDALRRESGLEELVPAREANPDVEPYLSVAASRAMDLRPEVRFESVADFAQALERPAGRNVRVFEGPRRTEPAYPPAPPPRLPGRTRKQIEQRTIWGLLGALILFVGVGLGLALASRSPAVQQAQVAATATLQSQIIAALTAITTVTPTPAPSATPIPTPAPLVDEKTGARMIYVPPGIFRMGNDDSEPDEAPSHIVRLDPYFVDETEATNGQYAVCVEEGVCAPPDRPGATFHPAYFGDSAYDNYPVLFVSWYDARAFCNWRGARLPTEAEWEKAAGFDPAEALKYAYPWGDAFDGTLLNFCDANCTREDRNTTFNDGHRDTAPVASLPGGRSPLGLYDMAGNVMEWISDWYDPRAYASSSDVNPLGPLDGQFKVIRGGSWLSTEEDVRVTGRTSYDPTVSRANLGFRCAVTAP
ncbi:MAG: SUMF1/EgtB/PvdO family nonheme iron enzyme, partial [Chloroflexi bacterium]|nr:SUMF1/EgtB/PvdO family nonheme iron enzyme [Chloroflexota bacterium]